MITIIYPITYFMVSIVFRFTCQEVII